MVITHEEIEYAHKMGYKIFIAKGLISDNVGYPFKEFIDKLYAERKE